jgi:hypothetical protein
MIAQLQYCVRICVALTVCFGMTLIEKPSPASVGLMTAPVTSVSDPGVLRSSSSHQTIDSPPQPSDHDRVIQPGHRGSAVMRVQHLLTALGLAEHRADGLYTEETAQAVEAFQTVHRLPVTGYVDRDTWNALHQAMQSSSLDPSDTTHVPEPLSGSFPSAEAAPLESFSSGAPSPDSFLSGSLQTDSLQPDSFALNRSTTEQPLEFSTSAPQSSRSDSELPTIQPRPNAHMDEPSHWVQANRIVIAISAGLVGVMGLSSGFYVLGRRSARRSHHTQKKLATNFRATNFRATKPNASRPQASPNNSSESAHTPPALSQQNPIPNTLEPSTPVQENETCRQTSVREVLPDSSHASEPSMLMAQHPSVDVVEPTRLAHLNGVDALLAELENADPMQRRRAIWELGQRGTTDAIHPLLDQMMTADSQQRSLILGAIAEIGIRTLTPMNHALMVSLQDESADVRKNAIRDTARVYELMGQVNTMLRHASTDDHPEVRQTACWAMEQMNRMRSPASLEMAQSSSKPIRSGPLSK